MKQGWEKKKLPDILWFQEGPGVRKHQYVSEGIKLLNVANLVNGKLDLSTSDRYISIDEAYGKYKHFLVDEGDLILASSGIQVEYIEKKMGFVQKEHLPLCMNTSTIRFKTLDKDVLSIEYFMYFLKSYEFKRQLFSLITGCAQLNYGPSHLKQMVVPVPPIAEQEKIVAELDCLSGIIEKKKQQLKELDNLAQSIFYEMFGDPVENDKGWNVQGFSTACNVITDFVAAGSFADIKKNVQYKESQDYAQLVRTTDLKNKFMKSGFVYISESAFNYLWRVNLNQECIILPNVGVNCGEVYYVNPSMLPYSNNVLGPNAILVRSKKENHRYLSALFTTSYFQCQLKGIVNAVGQPKFNKTELKKLEVILPPLPLQQEFASKIEAIEKQKELIKQSIQETETLFNSRMDYYFN